MLLDSTRQKRLLLELLTEEAIAAQAFTLIAQGVSLGDEVVDVLRAVRDADVAPEAPAAPEAEP